MVGKVIKEIIIALSIALITMLIFALVLYNFLPNRKVVAEVTEYVEPEQIREQLADNVGERDEEPKLTYKVKADKLNNYESDKTYVPGKANPFSSTKKGSETTTEKPSTNTSNGNTSSENTSSGKSSNGKSSTSKNSTEEANNTSKNTSNSTEDNLK